MIEIRRTQEFKQWLADQRGRIARVRIVKRIDRLALGNAGQSRSVGEGIVELKIDHGPGYRVYYMQHEAILIIILCAGDKSSQEKDIRRAKEIAHNLDLEDLY